MKYVFHLLISIATKKNEKKSPGSVGRPIQDNWQPDDLPGYVHGTDELVAPHEEE